MFSSCNMYESNCEALGSSLRNEKYIWYQSLVSAPVPGTPVARWYVVRICPLECL